MKIILDKSRNLRHIKHIDIQASQLSKHLLPLVNILPLPIPTSPLVLSFTAWELKHLPLGLVKPGHMPFPWGYTFVTIMNTCEQYHV